MHRVQRVPKTESAGRVHTSTCTLAVLPKASPTEEVSIDPSDLRIDTYRASGAGGQHVNKTDSAVRITHLPTGVVVECQSERSQHQNKANALSVLATRLAQAERERERQAANRERRDMVGQAQRSEKIRTYNFAQLRVTDHRAGFTSYRLEDVLQGDLDELLDKVRAWYASTLLDA